ncbi:MAG: energy-coupling factor transporter transmembrane component T family protein [Clostridia bacterium]
MLTNVNFGQFVPGNSIIHRLDPRTKILLTILYIIVLFSARGLLAYLLIAGFSLGIVLIANTGIMNVLRSVKPLIIIIFLTVILHSLFNKEGALLISIGPIDIHQGGLYFGLLMASRLILLITFTSILTLTTSPIALTDGIERLLNPFKRFGLPAHELAMMMTIALRFIPTLLNEAQKIMKAQQSRGADFESGNILQRAKALLPLLVPLFISAFRRADELAMAMEARCYRGGEGRTRMKILKMSKLDIYAFATMIAFCVLIIGMRVRGI